MSTTAQDFYPLILDSITEGVFTVDSDFRITYFNAAAEAITGFSREQALKHKCYEVLRASVCQQDCPIRKSLETGQPQRNVRVTVLNSQMEEVPIVVSSAVLRDRNGEMIGGVEAFRDVSEVEALRSELSGRRVFGDMIGASPAMQQIFSLIPDVSTTDASVLIHGASGTGKELVARAIHDLSPRSNHAFVQVNCGALPDTLLESELFGYVRGAFTDARKDKQGRFQQADKGTLFLDEVGDLSPAFQVKLLRALQEGEVQPLGSTETLHVDVRIIAATNRDLRHLIAEGKFREDLYYRVCVIPIYIPPLRERHEDIIPLLERYISRLAARTGKPIRDISPAALTALCDYDYPGNVRELINILERAFVMCHGEQIDIIHLPLDVTARRGRALYHGPERLETSPPPLSEEAAGETAATSQLAGNQSDGWSEDRRRFPQQGQAARLEAHRLIDVLRANRWNRAATADALGMSRSTLWRRMKQYGLG